VRRSADGSAPLYVEVQCPPPMQAMPPVAPWDDAVRNDGQAIRPVY
jgi:hypothetical protein